MTDYESFAAFVASGKASFVRTSSAYWNGNGVGPWQEFPQGAIRQVDGVGAILEPSATNIIRYSKNIQNGVWGTVGSTKSNYEAVELGLFDEGAIVTSTGADWNRLDNNLLSPLVAGAVYTLQAWYMAGTSGRARFGLRDGAGGIETRLAGQVGALVVQASSLGLPVDVVNANLGNGLYYVRFAVTIAGGVTVDRVTFGPNTAVGGEDVILFGMQLEEGSASSTFIITAGAPASRAADDLTLHLPVGSHHLTVTFDDTSHQVFAGISGDYAIDAAALDRPVVRSLVVRAA